MMTRERLQSLIHYDPDTGVFTWRCRRGQRGAGKVAGSDDGDGYRRIKIDRQSYRAARLAWLYMTGDWPTDGMQIDHADCNSMNDRWANLRIATPSQNRANTTRPARNTSGAKGVSRHRSKWEARIGVRGKHIWLGVFDTKADAQAAYADAAIRYHGEFGRPA